MKKSYILKCQPLSLLQFGIHYGIIGKIKPAWHVAELPLPELIYSHTLSLPPGNSAGILAKYPRYLTILSLYERARVHTHTHIQSASCPLLIGSDRVRDDPNNNRFIDFTYSSVSSVGIFFHYRSMER
jgi:hypothetical protein